MGMSLWTIVGLVWGGCTLALAVLIRRDRGRALAPPCGPHPAIVRPYSDWVSTRVLAERGANVREALRRRADRDDREHAAVAAALASPRKGGGHA